jgi:geranylgeranyl pyrophosphate synthase
LETPTPLSIDAIYAPVQADLAWVQESLKHIVPPETALLAQSVAHSMQGQGKLLRPVLALLMSGATGGVAAAHIETAAVAELIHVATLLHDDVLDDADLRRGNPTVRALWGNKVSILSGDYLLAQASLKLSQLNQCRLVSIFAVVLSDLCDGEVEQIRTSYRLETSWDSYFRKSICKTASLFRACCESAGVINALPEDQIQRLCTFGEKFGLAFQIIDDLLDYTASAEQLGKPVFDDLRNGILNAPILLALEAFPPEDPRHAPFKALVERLFQGQADPATDAATTQALLELLTEATILEKTYALADQFVAEALEAIAFLPPPPNHAAMVGRTHHALRRNR